MRKLTVDDIVDHRAYERERDEFRAAIIAMKKRRRIALGDHLTIVFENTDTMRWQVQEMARAERMLTDDAIAGEVETYNDLIPDPGELSATLFIELTSDELLREWLPKLRDIEFAVRFDLGPRDADSVASCRGPARRGTADARRHHHDRALPPLPVRRRAARAARPRDRRGSSSTIPSTRCGWSSTMRNARSSPATSPTDAGPHQGPAAGSRAPAAAPAAHRRRRLRPARPRARRARAARRPRAGARPGSRSRSPPGTRGSCCPAPGWR